MRRQHKYGARRTQCASEHWHPSAAEARRCDYWRILKMAGAIYSWQREPCFDLPCGKYIADFKIVMPDRSVIIEEVKGFMTPTWRIKWKEMLIYHPDINLHVVRLVGKRWETIEPPKAWRKSR